MANKKMSRIPISDDDMNINGIKEDYYEGSRSRNGFIKIGLNQKGTTVINRSIEDSIAEKQRELERLRKTFSRVEDKEEEVRGRELITIKSGSGKSKKDKKKDKKKKKQMKGLPESSLLLMNALDEYKETYLKTKKDKDDEKSYDGVSIKTKTKKKEETEEEKEDRKKKEESEKFNKSFDDPIALMQTNIMDMDKTLKEIDGLLAETKESRARNKSTMLKDLIGSKVGLFSNKTQAIRSIADIQKNRIDLAMKKQKEAAGDPNEKNRNIVAISQAFPQLVAGGALKKSSKEDDDDDDDYKGKKEKKKWKDKKYDSDDYEDKFEKRAAALIKSGEIPMTAHEAAVEMEGKFKPAIKKSFKTEEWTVIAIDNNGNEIRNFKEKYPGLLPKRKQLNLKFDSERDIAKDRNTDMVYQVIMTSYV